MTPNSESSTGVLFVAIDVAKQIHEVLIEPPTGGRQRWRMVNCQLLFSAPSTSVATTSTDRFHCSLHICFLTYETCLQIKRGTTP
jgi:hypothetical protein